MIFCTSTGTVEILNCVPPPFRERAESYLVLRRDVDEWVVSGEIITPSLFHNVADKWYPCLRTAFEAMKPLCELHGIKKLYVLEDDLSALAELLR